MSKNEILQYFKCNPNRYDGNKTKWSYLLKHNIELYNLLKHYYPSINNETTIRDILYCIENDYNDIPTCAICNKPLHLTRNGHKPVYHFPLFCSKECRFSDNGKSIMLTNYKSSFEKKYGEGITNCMHVKETQEKRKATCKQLYGVEFPLQNSDILKQTYISQNGGEDIGVKHNQIFLEKVYLSKKQHHTFTTSTLEKLFEIYLKENFGENNVETQYKSNEYPYSCDFYIKDLNLYIELQANWMHGGKPFTNTKEDYQKVIEWKNKSNELNFKGKYKAAYLNAIQTWTIRDVEKRKVAKDNKLNYLEIFSNNLDDCIQQLNNYIKEQYNN